MTHIFPNFTLKYRYNENKTINFIKYFDVIPTYIMELYGNNPHL